MSKRPEKSLSESKPNQPDDQSQPQSARIVLVDDERSMRELLAVLFGSNGYDVRVCSGATQALRSLEERSADVVLSDICMPDITGLDLCRTLRQKHPGLPVILMTGSNLNYEDNEYAQTQAFRLLLKPFKNNDVLDTVRAAVSVSQK